MKKMKTLCALSCVALLSIQALQAEKVLFLTNQVPTVNQADLTVIEALEDEAYDVEVKLSQQFDKSTDLDGVDCIYVSEAIGSGDPATLYAAELAGEIGIAIINNEPYGYNMTDRFHWAAGNRKGNTDFGKLFVTEEGAAHPIFMNAGFTSATTDESEAIVVLQKADEAGSATKMCYVGMEDVTAGTVLAWDGSTVEGTGNKALIFVVEKGTELAPGVVATGRRIGFFMANGNNTLTDEGKAILLSAVAWGIEGNSMGVSHVEEPENSVAYRIVDGQILVNEENASLAIYTVTGALCESVQSVRSYDYSALAQGVYVARLQAGNKTEVFKFIVK